jgi:hypothetical protein
MAEPEGEAEKKDAAPQVTPAAAATPAVSAERTEAAKKALPPRRKWATPPPPAGNKWVWRVVFIATFVAVLLLGVIVLLLVNSNKPDEAPKLAEEFRDTVNSNYAIRPPVNWILLDPHDGRNFNIVGPKERGFLPLMQICFDVAPGHLDSYLKEFEARDLAGTQLVSQTREKLDGKDTARLLYTWDTVTEDSEKKPVKVKTVQYILEDVPRFYRITCSVREDLFDKYIARFEASVKTFKILPITESPYKVVPPGN